MKAWLWKGNLDMELVETPVPSCRDGWVLIRVHSAGVCATDNHIYRGRFFNGPPPHILGHEMAGEVVELGKGVPSEWLGKRVTVETAVGCGICQHCRSGNKHLCDAGAEVGFPPYSGAYAEYTSAPYTCLHELPAQMPYDTAGILEAVACPVGAVQRLGMSLGETVLIQGAGVAGLSFLQAAKAFHAGKVIMSVRRDIKAQQARDFGADVIVDTRRENLLERVLEETNGKGVDLSIDAAGVAETVTNSISCCRKDGRVLLYGIPDAGKEIPFPVTDIIMKQLRLYGVTNNEWIWDPLLALAQQNVIRVGDMVTHTFPMEGLKDALNQIENREETLIKAVLHPWEHTN